MDWQPHITVATIVEDNGRFLMVEELKHGRVVLNQPAGHLDPNETLTEAAVRETLEETGWDVEPTGVLGIYLYRTQQRRDLPTGLLHRQAAQTPPGLPAGRRYRRRQVVDPRRINRAEGQLAQRADYPLYRRLSGRQTLRSRIDPPFSLALRAPAC